MFTLLVNLGEDFRGVPRRGRVGKAGRRQRLVGARHAGGERRRLFGVGEGPAEAVAGAKQDAWNGPTQAGVRNNDLRFGYCGWKSRASPRLLTRLHGAAAMA